MKIRTVVLLVPVLLTLCVGTAVAKPAAQHSGVDPSFGHGGTIDVAVPKRSAERSIQMATAPSGKTYVLAGSTLLAFGANGRPDAGFADHGHLSVAAAAGETTEVTGLAVDAQGRILVSGSVNPTPGVPVKVVPPSGFTLGPVAPSNAFIIRYLPDGERDPAFGGSGEIAVTVTPQGLPGEAHAHFEQPIVHAKRLAVVNGEQPVLGGSYEYEAGYCRSLRLRASGFVGAIDAGGPSTQSIAGTQNSYEGISYFATMPAGNLAALSDPAAGCGTEGSPAITKLSVLDYGSTPAPTLDPARPDLSLNSMAVDPHGRFLGLEGPEGLNASSNTVSWKLMRLLPDGAFDTSFGSNGGVPLKKFYGEPVGALVTDAKSRITVGGGEDKFRLVRFGTKGKVDHSFGRHGWLEVGFGPGTQARVGAISVDVKGRIVVAGRVMSPSLKTGEGIGVARFLPGR